MFGSAGTDNFWLSYSMSGGKQCEIINTILILDGKYRDFGAAEISLCRGVRLLMKIHRNHKGYSSTLTIQPDP